MVQMVEKYLFIISTKSVLRIFERILYLSKKEIFKYLSKRPAERVLARSVTGTSPALAGHQSYLFALNFNSWFGLSHAIKMSEH